MSGTDKIGLNPTAREEDEGIIGNGKKKTRVYFLFSMQVYIFWSGIQK